MGPRACRVGPQSESGFGDEYHLLMLRARGASAGRALGRVAEPASETLEQRVARLSISIATHVAAAQNAQDRRVILDRARDEVTEDLVARGHPLHEAALIADDVIEGAHRLASVLMTHARQSP